MKKKCQIAEFYLAVFLQIGTCSLSILVFFFTLILHMATSTLSNLLFFSPFIFPPIHRSVCSISKMTYSQKVMTVACSSLRMFSSVGRS